MRLAVLGCGNMGNALLTRLQNLYGNSWEIKAFDHYAEALAKLPAGVKVESPEKWFLQEVPDVVLLAVKPQGMKEALSVFTTPSQTLWISIAAGVTIDTLVSYLPAKSRVCRVMPNTPALIGEAVSAFCLSSQCSDEDGQVVGQIFSAVGITMQVVEEQMAVVTGLSGSGPAYVYSVIEALADGAVANGMPYQMALESAVQTVIGAARMVQETGESPDILRSRVMSPGGTTVAGVRVLEERGLHGILVEALTAATDRALELAKDSPKKMVQ